MIQQQEKLVQIIVENQRNGNQESARSLIKRAGYSNASADHPSQVLLSTSFQALLERYLPDQFVLEMMHDVLKQTENHMARAKAADLVFRIKGQYAPPKMPVDPYDSLTENEIDAEIRKLEQAKLEKIKRGSTITEGVVVAQESLSDDNNDSV